MGWRDGGSIATSRLLAVSTEILILKDCGRFSSAELTTGRCHPRSQPTACSASIFSSAPLRSGRAGIQTWRVSRHASAVSDPGGKRAMARPGALFVKGKALHDLYRQVIAKKTSE